MGLAEFLRKEYEKEMRTSKRVLILEHDTVSNEPMINVADKPAKAPKPAAIPKSSVKGSTLAKQSAKAEERELPAKRSRRSAT